MLKLNDKIKENLLSVNKKALEEVNKKIEQKQNEINFPNKEELSKYRNESRVWMDLFLFVFMNFALLSMGLKVFNITNMLAITLSFLFMSSFSFLGCVFLVKQIKSIFIRNKEKELEELKKEKEKIEGNVDIIKNNNIPVEYENNIISKDLLVGLRNHIENKEVLDMMFAKNEKTEINYKQLKILLDLKKSTISSDILKSCNQVC